jgi:hypothetical protein
MFGSRMLEVVIGVIFVFLLVSIICSTVREVLEARLKTRAAYLEQGVRELLHDTNASGLARSIYEHPLIKGLYGGEYAPSLVTKRQALLARGRALPSYIPSRNFALALMDIAARGPITDVVSGDPDGPALSLESMRNGVPGLQNPAVQRVLLTAIDSARGDIDKAQATIEAWYDSGMDRVSGWYKRSTAWIIFWIALAVAIGLNINTLTIVDYLYRNDSARLALVARAASAAKDSTILGNSFAETKATLDSVRLPIGWSNDWRTLGAVDASQPASIWSGWIYPALGLLLTALAATMGAPFWFDLLNKVSVVRSTVKPHEKSREEASEDRQLPAEKDTGSVARELVSPSSGPSATTGSAGARPDTTRDSPLHRPSPRDAASNEDACDAELAGGGVVVTADEDLPPARGGVA